MLILNWRVIMPSLYLKKTILIFITFLIGLVNFAQSASHLDDLPPLIDRKKFFGNPKISSPAISPNGKYIAFIKPYQGVRNVYVKKRGEDFDKAQPVTADDRPVPGYFWSQDSKYILYVQDKGGNENYHVYAVDPSAKNVDSTGVPPARDLTPVEGVKARIYSVPENTPNKIIVGLNNRKKAYHDLYEVNISTGERNRIYKNTKGLASYTFDLKGNLRLATRQTDQAGTEILRYKNGKFKRIYKCAFGESCSPIRFHKNGEKVYFTTNKGNDVNYTRLTLLNPKTGETEFIEMDPQEKVDFGGAMFNDKTEELMATYYIDKKQRIYPKTTDFKEDLEFLRNNLPKGKISIVSKTENMNFMLVRISSSIDPGSVYLYNRKEKKVKLLYKSRPELKSKNLAKMKPINYEARDGTKIPAFLTIPKGVEAKDLPAIMLIHGGPWARVYPGYNNWAQFLANRGYVVLQPNFRGSIGYGKKFLNAGNEEWGTGIMQHDISDGVKYLIEEGYADTSRIGIFGGSYGGYATLAGLAFTPELYSVGVSYVGPSNLLTLLNSIPPYWKPTQKRLFKRVGNPNKEEDKKRLKKQSPLFSAENIDDPLLVIQGANDPRVKKQEADQIVVAGRENNLDMKYLVAPQEGHGFRKLNNRLVVAAAMEKFLAQHINGRYQEETSQEVQAQWNQLKKDIDQVSLPEPDSTKERASDLKSSFPQFNAEKIKPFQANYQSTINLGGREIKVDLTREIYSKKFNENESWLIVDKSKAPQGTSLDSLYLDKKTCLPIKRIMNRPRATISMNYSGNKIQGTLEMRGKERELKAKTSGKFLSGLQLSLMAMDISSDYQAVFNTFNVLKNKQQKQTLKVVGEETIKVPAGTFPTFKIEITPENTSRGKQTLFLSKEEPRKLVKTIRELPKRTGGKAITELQKISWQ